MMRMPGFTAEESLDKSSVHYHKRGPVAIHVSRIVPQLPVRSCILTEDGGLWCCVPGKMGPVCWKFPPPPVIWTLY
jgi:hypothetical protein